MTSVVVRACSEADWATVVHVDQLAFGYTFDEVENAADRNVLELDRSFLAYVGDTPVGHTTAFSLCMSVPVGREVAFAGVTWVGVLPTHRRRGVLTALMRSQLDAVHESGEPVAALHAAEPAIYGRFGYGLATQRLSVSVLRGHTALEAPVDAALTARLSEIADARAAVEEVYAAVRGVRAGIPARSDLWWDRCANDPKSARDGASERRCVLIEDAAGPRAYAMFSVKHDWPDGSAEGELRVREHAATDPAAAAALWRFLLNVDLVGRVVHESLAVDDPLLELLADPRRARPVRSDAVYVRLVDLPVALAARTYDVPYDGVVEVVDGFAPWNAGRWRLALRPDGAECTRTDAEPDVVLDVRELGAAYLGGTSLVTRAGAGFVGQRTAGAVAALGRAFVHEPAPYCPFVY
ncbi:MAG TPA: GNAT family N-acetyltransferase [Actinomycetes bacterium]